MSFCLRDGFEFPIAFGNGIEIIFFLNYIFFNIKFCFIFLYYCNVQYLLGEAATNPERD